MIRTTFYTACAALGVALGVGAAIVTVAPPQVVHELTKPVQVGPEATLPAPSFATVKREHEAEPARSVLVRTSALPTSTPRIPTTEEPTMPDPDQTAEDSSAPDVKQTTEAASPTVDPAEQATQEQLAAAEAERKAAEQAQRAADEEADRQRQEDTPPPPS